MNSSESHDVINDSPNGVRFTKNDEPINADTSTQRSSSSSTTTTKKTTLPAVVFIPKPTISTTATPSSSFTPTPSIDTSEFNGTNDSPTADNSKIRDSLSIVPNLINDNENIYTKTKNVWDQEQTGNSDSEVLESEEEDSGSGAGVYEISTPEYLEDLLNYKKIYPRFKNPIDEEYLKKIARD